MLRNVWQNKQLCGIRKRRIKLISKLPIYIFWLLWFLFVHFVKNSASNNCNIFLSWIGFIVNIRGKSKLHKTIWFCGLNKFKWEKVVQDLKVHFQKWRLTILLRFKNFINILTVAGFWYLEFDPRIFNVRGSRKHTESD